MSPRRGTAPPRGTPGCLRRCAPAGSAPSSPGRGWPDLCPPRGPGSAALPRALGPEGRERRAPGRTRGASRAGAQAWGKRPWAPVRASSASPYAFRSSLSVCLSLGAYGAPGEARPAHLPPPGKRDRSAAARVLLGGLLAAPRATALLGDSSWEPRKKPAPLPLPLPPPLPPSPIPERSPRSLAAWEALGPRGRVAGEAAPREGGERSGRKEGVSSLRMGKARRGREAPPQAGSPGSWAPWPCTLPAATLLRLVHPQAREGCQLQGSRAAGSEQQRALWAGRGGIGGEHLLGEGRQSGGPIA